MGMSAQRKQFEHIDLAREAADHFLAPEFAVPGIKTRVMIEEQGEEVWLTVSQEGDIITGEEPLLPGYERVQNFQE
jgi:hypothetical protein